jgi:hypothetical protein
MEDVLDLYAEPDDPHYPQVCFDESPVQLTSETRHPLPARPGHPERYDTEYKREGTANLFLFVQPLRGWRHVNVTKQRTKQDFAQQMRLLVDQYFPTAERIRLVVDNLNTHTPAALYGAFPPDEARRITRKLEFHYPPSMAVGSIWPSASWPFWPASVWIAAFRTSKPCRRKSPLGNASAISTKPKSTGSSVPTWPGANSSASILPWNSP